MISLQTSESQAHRELKRAALKFAMDHGFAIAAVEVLIPDRGVRADVAAYISESLLRGGR